LIELLVVIGIIAVLIAILLPAMKNAREQSKSVQCLSNLKQMMLAANMYQQTNAGRFPLATYIVVRSPVRITYNWDFIEERNTSTGQRTITPGTLWWSNATTKIQQCPSFDGVSVGFASDPHTGYNYNTSFVGREANAITGEVPVPPAKASQIRKPSQTAVFGDGEYGSGANKFMRSPFPSDGELVIAGRYAGTQGFRHRGRTNVAFADGHAETTSGRFTQTMPADAARVAPRTGFLSPDNSLYDLD
jgi:prepilin-type processing-associated H-X9-DG protein